MPMEIVNESPKEQDGENNLSVLFPTFEDGEQGSNAVEYQQSPKEPIGNLEDFSGLTWQELKSKVSTQCSKLKSKSVSLSTFERNTSSLIFEMASRLERGEVPSVQLAKADVHNAQLKKENALEGLKNA